VGFVLVGTGGLPNLAFFSQFQSSFDFYWIVTALGYVVLAWASWVDVGPVPEERRSHRDAPGVPPRCWLTSA
jgi:hypothetical protein